MHFLTKKHCFWPRKALFCPKISKKSAYIATNLNLRQKSVCSGLKFLSESKLFGGYHPCSRATSATLPSASNGFIIQWHTTSSIKSTRWPWKKTLVWVQYSDLVYRMLPSLTLVTLQIGQPSSSKKSYRMSRIPIELTWTAKTWHLLYQGGRSKFLPMICV